MPVAANLFPARFSRNIQSRPETGIAVGSRLAFRLGYEPALDGLRALAVISVMFAHLSLMGSGFDLSRPGSIPGGLRGGFLGVDVFFVLSGFLITALLLKEEAQTGQISLKGFYGRRVLRILPALGLVLGACCLCAAFKLGVGYSRPVFRNSVMALCCSVNTYFCVTGLHAGILTHLWSLGVEEKFYFIWPVVLRILLQLRVRRHWVFLLIAGGVVSCAVFRTVCWWYGGDFGARVGICSLPARADNLLLGVLVALWVCWLGLARSSVGRFGMRLGAWTGGLVLAWMVYSCDSGPVVYLAAGLAAALLIAGLVAGRPPLLRAALTAPPLVWVGRISYGLYLWHLPVFCLAPLAVYRFLGRGPWTSAFACAAAFALSVGAAAASHYLVERPFLRWKARFTYA